MVEVLCAPRDTILWLAPSPHLNHFMLVKGGQVVIIILMTKLFITPETDNAPIILIKQLRFFPYR